MKEKKFQKDKVDFRHLKLALKTINSHFVKSLEKEL